MISRGDRGDTVSNDPERLDHDCADGKSVNVLFDFLNGRSGLHTDFVETLTEIAHVIVLVLDPEGKIAYFNPYLEELSGYRLEEVLGKDWFRTFIPDDEKPLIKGAFAKTLDVRRTGGIVNAILTKDGRRRMVNWSNKVLSSPEGDTIGILCVGRQVDSRGHSERKRLQTEVDHPVFEYSPVPMILLDRDRRVRRANRAALRLTGRSAQAIDGQSSGRALRCIHSLDDPDGCGFGPLCQGCRVRQAVVDTLETGGAHQRIEASLPVAGGNEEAYLHLLVSSVPVSVSGRPMALVCIEDVTELKRVEKALRDERDNEQRYLDVAEIILVALNDEGIVTRINQKGCKLLGYEEHEIVGQRWPDMFAPPLVKEELKSLLGKVMQKKLEPADYYETPVLTRSGEVRLIAWHNALVVDKETGGSSVLLCSGEDITDRRRAEEELQHLHEKLQQKNDDLQAILHAVGHDLRAPLLSIQGFSKRLVRTSEELPGVLSGDSLTDELKARLLLAVEERIPKDVEVIVSCASRMDSLLKRLLQLSRSGAEAISVAQLDVNSIISSIITAMELEIDEVGATISVTDLPPCLGDEVQVSEVFSNLIHNALKYRDTSRRCEVWISGYTEKGQTIYCVKDNGTGIPKEYGEDIFRIFGRVDDRKVPGEGLGLAIVKRILERLNGKIWFESEEGEGTKFFVSLPARPSEATNAES